MDHAYSLFLWVSLRSIHCWASSICFFEAFNLEFGLGNLHSNQPVLHIPVVNKQTIDGREGLNYLSPFPRRLNKWHEDPFERISRKNPKVRAPVNLWFVTWGFLNQSIFWIWQNFRLSPSSFAEKEKFFFFNFEFGSFQSFTFSSWKRQSFSDQIVLILLRRVLAVNILFGIIAKLF